MNLTQVIKRPVITEKSHLLIQGSNKYTLIVDNRAGKNVVKQAVEELFGVPVINVRIINMNSHTKRVGKLRRVKTYPGFKKAVVTLPKGKKIPLFEFEGEKK